MIECKENYEAFYKEVVDHDLILQIIPSQPDWHAAACHSLALFTYDVQTHKSYAISFSHPDIDFKVALNDPNHRFSKQNTRLWTLDKKSFIQILPIRGIRDINLLRFLKNNSIFESKPETPAHSFIKRIHNGKLNLGRVIPLLKHKEVFESQVADFIDIVSQNTPDLAYNKVNEVVIETLAELEHNGIFVNPDCFGRHFGEKTYPYKGSMYEKVVYSQYNIYTSTGRPSNRFDGVNYAALNKDNGCRSCFVSRHLPDIEFKNEEKIYTKKHGMMLLVDYSAFHPRIICNLVNFNIPIDVDIYRYLGEIYFNKQNLTPIDLDEAKNLTFRQLYGGVEKPYENIRYFQQLSGFKEDNWKFFQQHGYVETPFFGRKITSHHIQDPNPNKLFNYILQATETEIAIPVIQKLNTYLRNKKTKTVLYTYDSVLFDFNRNDGESTLKDIVEIMGVDKKFPLKMYIGDSYNDLNQFSISQ